MMIMMTLIMLMILMIIINILLGALQVAPQTFHPKFAQIWGEFFDDDYDYFIIIIMGGLPGPLQDP